MEQIVVQVKNKHKAKMLFELLTSLDFVNVVKTFLFYLYFVRHFYLSLCLMLFTCLFIICCVFMLLCIFFLFWHMHCMYSMVT